MGAEVPQWAGLVEERLDFLERLADHPAHKPALETDLDCSRSTVDRAIRRLEAAGLIHRTDEGYAITAVGRLAVDRYREYAADQRTIDAARPMLETLPPDATPPAAVLTGGTVETVEGETGRAFERIARSLRTARTYRAVLPRVVDSRHVRLLHARVVQAGTTADVVVDPDLADRLREEFPGLTSDLLAAESCTLGRGSVPPYGLVLAAGEEGPTTLLVTYDGGSIAGVVENDGDPAVGRVETVVDRHLTESAVLPDPTAGNQNGTPVFGPEMATHRALARAGLTRVDQSSFRERTPGDPETAWRIGFDLVEVYYGYAVERTDPSLASGDTSTEGDHGRPEIARHLVDRLAAGDDHVVVGPPGAGKSTVCQQVACRWIQADHGPVYYREATAPAEGTGDEDALAAAIDVVSSSERALVVVENAAGPVTESLLGLLRAVREDPSVAVLAEARESHWHGAVDSVPDPRLRHVARDALSTYRLPAVDEEACRRAIEAFEATTGQDVPLSSSHLYNRVTNEGGLGEMQVLGHQVVAHATPWLDASIDRSALDGDVRATYEAVTGSENDTVDAPRTTCLTVGLLVAVLTTAEWPVTPGLVHALAADVASHSERSRRAHRHVEAALDGLEGRMYVRRDGDPVYRTQHPQWAARFLEHALDRAERETVALFERAVNAVLALADDPDRRRRIEGWLGRDSPAVQRFADPDAVGEFVETLFGLGLEHADLAPLFGVTEHSGIDLPDACPVAAELEARALRGKMWYDRGDCDRAERELTELCDRAEGADCDASTRTASQAEANRLLAEVVLDDADTDRAAEYLERSLAAARRGDHPRHEIGALNSLAWAAMSVDDYDRAEDHLESALAVAEERGLDACFPHSTTRYYMAKLALFRGDLDTAEEWLSRTVELDRELGNTRNVSYSRKLLGDVAKDRGDLGEAVAHYRRSLVLKRQVGDRSGTAGLLVDLADLHLERGDTDRAEGALAEALDIAKGGDMDRYLGQVHGGLGRLALERGALERAVDHFETQRAVHDAADYDRGVASATVGFGDVARQRGNLREARACYRDAFEHYREIGDRRAAVEALEDLVDACLAAGDEAAAVDWCEEGVDFAAGLDGLRERLAERLGEFGVEADVGQ